MGRQIVSFDSISNRRKRDKKRAKLQYILTIPLMDVKIYDDNLPNVLGVLRWYRWNAGLC